MKFRLYNLPGIYNKVIRSSCKVDLKMYNVVTNLKYRVSLSETFHVHSPHKGYFMFIFTKVYEQEQKRGGAYFA